MQPLLTLGEVAKVRRENLHHVMQELEGERRLRIPRRHGNLRAGGSATAGWASVASEPPGLRKFAMCARSSRCHTNTIAAMTHRIHVAMLYEHERCPVNDLDRRSARLLASDHLRGRGSRLRSDKGNDPASRATQRTASGPLAMHAQARA